MGKIYDYLENYKKEKNASGLQREAVNNNIDEWFEMKKSSIETVKNMVDKNHFDKNLITILKPQSFEAEQYRLLRSALLFPASGTLPRSIMVTSAVPAEGKSTVASNLAISIAQNVNDYVLLIDCDLRRPTLQKYFGLGNMPGLGDHLLRNMPLSALIIRTNINNLVLLPAGKPSKNSSELLSSNKMAGLIKKLRSKYRDLYIVIDTPPPMLSSETGAILRLVDGYLLVVKYRNTKRKFITDLTNLLGKEKILGIALNMFDKKVNSYEYRQYRKYYESYSNK